MEKIRLNLTVEDYYDYVGTNPYYNTLRRVKDSLPYEFSKGYNLKFKMLKKISYYRKWYRVHITVMMPIETLDKVVKDNQTKMHRFEDLSYRIICRKP